MKLNPSSTIVPRIIFLAGMLAFFIIFLNQTFTFKILHLPKWSQFAYALVIALIGFFASHISNRKDYNKIERLAVMITFLPWISLVVICVAIFLVLANFETEIVRLGILTNYYLNGFILFYAYLIIFTYWYPQTMSKEQIMSSDKLKNLPKDSQELVDKSRESVDKITIKVIATCAILVSISIFFLGSVISPLTFLIIEILVAIIVILIARYFAAYKWQKRAIQSGIPEKKLRSAMKLAGLPWLNVKKE